MAKVIYNKRDDACPACRRMLNLRARKHSFHDHQGFKVGKNLLCVWA